MAKKKTEKAFGRPKVYPWAKWFDGKRHKLKTGEDFRSSNRVMAVYIYTRAKQLGVKVSVNELPNGALEVRSKTKYVEKPRSKKSA